jgi:hypothetical protein
MMNTFFRASKPSISLSNWLTTRTLAPPFNTASTVLLHTQMANSLHRLISVDKVHPTHQRRWHREQNSLLWEKLVAQLAHSHQHTANAVILSTGIVLSTLFTMLSSSGPLTEIKLIPDSLATACNGK